MKKTLILVFLGCGVVLGFASGFHQLRHHHRDCARDFWSEQQDPPSEHNAGERSERVRGACVTPTQCVEVTPAALTSS